jgi:putative ABC transport system permease protein
MGLKGLKRLKRVFKLAFSLLFIKKWRTILTILGVSFGIGLMISMVILQGKMDKAVEQEVKERFGDVDMLIGYRSDGKFINPKQLEQIRAVNGILEASPVLVNPHLTNSEQQYSSNGIYYIGYDNSSLAKSYYKITEYLDNDEVILSKNLAATLKVKAKQSVSLPLPGQKTKKFHIDQVIKPLGAQLPDIAILPIKTLQETVMMKNDANLILLNLSPHTNKQFIAEQLKDEIDQELDIDYLSAMEDLKENILNIKILGYGLGFVTIILSSLFVLGNFQLTLFERTKELSILRSIGGSRKQIFTLVMIEGMIVGVLGMILGISLGLITANTLSSIISKILNVPIVNVPINWVVLFFTSLLAFLFTLLVILIPAKRASKILPIQAIRMTEMNEYKQPQRLSLITSIILISVGIPMLLAVNKFAQFKPILSIAAGFVLLFGIVLGFSYLINSLLKLLLVIIQRTGHGITFIVLKNAIEQGKTNYITILIFSSVIALSIGTASLITTIKHDTVNNLKKEYLTDFVASSSMQMMSTLPYEITKDIKAISGVKEVIPVSTWASATITKINENNQNMKFNFLLTDQEKLIKEKMVPASLKKYKNPVVIPQHYAEKLNVTVGDTLQIETNGGDILITIGAIMNSLPGASNINNHGLVDWNNPVLNDGNKMIKSLLIEVDERHKSSVTARLDELSTVYPELRWSSYDSAVKESEKLIGQRIMIFTSFLIVTFTIGTLGIVNNLAANLFAKRREHAILRAINLTPSQLSKLIIIQGFLYSILSAIVGSLMGLILAYSLVQSLGGTWLFPWYEYNFIILFVFFITTVITLPFAYQNKKKTVTTSLVMD